MFEWLFHLIGICPDHLSHPNLLWLLTIGGASFLAFKTKIKSIFYRVFRKNPSMADQQRKS